MLIHSWCDEWLKVVTKCKIIISQNSITNFCSSYDLDIPKGWCANSQGSIRERDGGDHRAPGNGNHSVLHTSLT